MATKEEYLEALNQMKNAFHETNFLSVKAMIFDDNLNLLRKLVNEHFEEKQAIKSETNFDHYFEYLATIKLGDLALIDGRVKRCLDIHCSECAFNGDCIERKFEWLKQPYKKPTYKLSRFEFDLLNTFDRCKECCLLNEIECLKKLSKKGYFNGIDPFTKVHDVIDNCEVIE